MSALSQAFPPAPSFTETSLPSLSSKTYIVTGATSGVGLELAKILYSRSATVYIAARNSTKIADAIKTIAPLFPNSKGRLESLVVDLSDLESVAPAANIFKSNATRLDGLVLNAAVMTPPTGAKGKQGHELQMSTNCLGGYLLMKCLEDILVSTAKTSKAGDVRVVWLSSFVQVGTPKGGVVWDDDKNEPKLFKDQMANYMLSKVGNIFLAQDTATRLGKHGVISVSINPGLMKTELQRHKPSAMSTIMGVVFKGPKFGAYSELFGLMSPKVTMEKNGAFVIPWGRFGSLPDDIKASMKGKSQGGTGVANTFLEWCERETVSYR